jgi:hypothetical protein
VKHSDGVSRRPDGAPVSPDSVFGCPDDTVGSPGRACLCDLLRGTTSGRHLISVQTVNPVGLNRILPAPHITFSSLLVLFVVLCIFSVLFMRTSQVHVSSLQFISTPGVFLCLK